MKNILKQLKEVVANNYDGHLSISECVSINAAITELYKWASVFGHLGTADECGNEWIKLQDTITEKDARIAELESENEEQRAEAIAYDLANNAPQLKLRITQLEEALKVAREALKAKSYIGDMQAINKINEVIGS